MLHALATGKDVELEPSSSEMTPTEAATYLNVSRPTVVKLMDEGKLSYRMVGTHRRLPTTEVVAHKRVTRARQRQAMDDVVRISEEMGLYDDPAPPPTKSEMRGKPSDGR